MTNEVMSCTLQGDELSTRIAEWASVARQSLSRHIESDRIVSTYPADPEIDRRLRELIAAEAECCTFMKFTIEETGEHLVVKLQVPDGMVEPIAAMLGVPATS